MKKLLKILLSLFILALLFFGVFLAVNLWPRAVEPPLWTEADLELPQEKDQNGYYFMLQMQEDPNLESLFSSEIDNGMEVPGDLEGYTSLGFFENPTDRTLFWMDAKGLQPVFSAFVEKYRPQIEEYEKFISFPQFVDQTPILLDERRKTNWLFYHDLHKLGKMHILNQILKGNNDQAYAFWLKMFEQDVSLLKSARGLLTHMIALSDVKADLSLLDGIRQFPPSAELQTKIRQALQDFDPSSFDMRRAVIMEYLEHQSSADAIQKGARKETALRPRISFNRAVFQREENDYFRRLDRYRKEPAAITEEALKQFEQESNKLNYAAGGKYGQLFNGKHDPFWWFFNPAGKVLRAIVTVNFIGRIQEFHHTLEDIQKMKSQLLAGALFSTAPETQKSETQSAETQPAESHPTETKKLDPTEIQKDAL